MDGFIEKDRGRLVPALSMVSSKDTKGEQGTFRTAPINGFIEGQGAQSMVSLKDAKEVGNREQWNTTRTAGYAWHFTCDLPPKETP